MSGFTESVVEDATLAWLEALARLNQELTSNALGDAFHELTRVDALSLIERNRTAHRVLVKRILRKHGYPPDLQEKATQTVMEQAEVLSEIWASA